MDLHKFGASIFSKCLGILLLAPRGVMLLKDWLGFLTFKFSTKLKKILRLKYSKIYSLMDLGLEEEFLELVDRLALIVNTFFYSDIEV